MRQWYSAAPLFPVCVCFLFAIELKFWIVSRREQRSKLSGYVITRVRNDAEGLAIDVGSWVVCFV
jgi:hypothetical protein